MLRAVRHDLPDVAVTVAGVRQVSASTIATVGAYVVVVATVLPNRAITLTSCYLGRQGADTAATHLLLAVDEPPRLEHRLLPGTQPGVTAPRVCLLDHVAELQAALALPGQPAVQIDVGPAALALTSHSWAPPRPE